MACKFINFAGWCKGMDTAWMDASGVEKLIRERFFSLELPAVEGFSRGDS